MVGVSAQSQGLIVGREIDGFCVMFGGRFARGEFVNPCSLKRSAQHSNFAFDLRKPMDEIAIQRARCSARQHRQTAIVVLGSPII